MLSQASGKVCILHVGLCPQELGLAARVKKSVSGEKTLLLYSYWSERLKCVPCY